MLAEAFTSAGGFVNGLRYAFFDPHRLIAKLSERARRKGRQYFEIRLGGRRLVVVFTPPAADAVLRLLDTEAVFFQADQMSDWLGAWSPIAATGLAHVTARRIAESMLPRHSLEELTDVIHRHVSANRSRHYDVGPAVRRAALEWGISGICAATGEGWDDTTVAAAVAWFEAADSIFALVPPLRRLTGWEEQVRTRADVIQSLGLHVPRQSAVARGYRSSAERFPSRTILTAYQDAAMTMLIGCLNPTMVALDAWLIAARAPEISVVDAYNSALKRPPLPLLVREVVCEELKLADCILKRGDGLAVATASTGRQFGGEDHECIGRRRSFLFTRALFAAFSELNLKPRGARPEVRRHMHFSYGVTNLNVTEEDVLDE